LYFVAQKLEKRTFVASTALFFFVTNWMKLPPYLVTGVVDKETLLAAAKLAPMVPIGVGVGWVLNRTIPQKYFVYVVYVLLVVAGLDLTFR
jgi:uncharacterized membrane protein YfcA